MEQSVPTKPLANEWNTPYINFISTSLSIHTDDTYCDELFGMSRTGLHCCGIVGPAEWRPPAFFMGNPELSIRRPSRAVNWTNHGNHSSNTLR